MNYLQALSRDIKQIRSLTPRSVRKLIWVLAFIGILGFFVESSMIIVLQGVLVSLGLLGREVSSLPSYYPVTIVFTFLAVAIFGLLRSITSFLKNYLAALSQHRFNKEIRDRILMVAVKKGNIISHDEVMAVFSEIVSQSGNVIHYLNHLTASIISATFILALGLYIAPFEMLLGIFSLALIAIPYKKYSKSIKQSGAGLVSEWERINNVLLVSLKNNFFLKVFNLEQKEIEKGKRILKTYEDHLQNYSFISAFFSSLPAFLGVLVVCFVTVIGKQYLNSDSTKLLAFYYLFIRFSQFASESYQSFSFYSLNQEGIRKLDRWLKANENTDDAKIDRPKSPLKSSHELSVELKNVSFGYASESLFKDLSLTLKKGDFLLIKGNSGSGKSTLLSILFGLLKPNSGEVVFNTQKNVKNISELVGYVGPEPYLIPATVRENLLYGFAEEVSEESMFEALEEVGLKELILSYPDKLSHHLMDHAQISTGQKQRLSLARALIRKSPILVLDEATANIDKNTEERILKVLGRQKQAIITIAVTHKDSFDGLATLNLRLGEKNT